MSVDSKLRPPSHTRRLREEMRILRRLEIAQLREVLDRLRKAAGFQPRSRRGS